jgi:hypothetical protein
MATLRLSCVLIGTALLSAAATASSARSGQHVLAPAGLRGSFVGGAMSAAPTDWLDAAVLLQAKGVDADPCEICTYVMENKATNQPYLCRGLKNPSAQKMVRPVQASNEAKSVVCKPCQRISQRGGTHRASMSVLSTLLSDHVSFCRCCSA